jgi:glycine/D-amino acid oxidase-like deaminating enzyme
MTDNRNISFWWDTLSPALTKSDRPELTNDLDVDIAIVGGGYTGLWTAYYLAKQNPNLTIAIVEAQVVGFGASGRNGGWCSALFPTSVSKLAKQFGPNSAVAMQRAMHTTVSEIEQVVASENIDCDWQRGGSLVFARTPLQQARAQAEIAEWESWGFDSTDYAYLSPEQTAAQAKVTNNFGSIYTKHVAAINPAKLVRELARLVETLGVQIFENTTVVQIHPGMVVTPQAVIRSKYVVRATEGYTPSIEGHKRIVAPIYSLMLATEPLSEADWDQIGLAKRQTFSDGRNLIIYGQRTADNRFAFGGRGAPYHFGSKIKAQYDQVPKVHNALIKILGELFPVVQNKAVTHTWGGPLGITRDWMPSVGLNKHTGLAWAGGYVGDGVGTSNLAGRTLADLISHNASNLIDLPWVNHKSPNWELEPLRWLGANIGLQAMTFSDHFENRSGKDSVIPKIVGRFTGK